MGVWTRSPSSASAVCYVNTNGNLITNSPTSYNSARPDLRIRETYQHCTRYSGIGCFGCEEHSQRRTFAILTRMNTQRRLR